MFVCYLVNWLLFSKAQVRQGVSFFKLNFLYRKNVDPISCCKGSWLISLDLNWLMFLQHRNYCIVPFVNFCFLDFILHLALPHPQDNRKVFSSTQPLEILLSDVMSKSFSKCIVVPVFHYIVILSPLTRNLSHTNFPPMCL